MPQIIINTKGGLGNILFQLAAGLNFAKKFNLGIIVTSQPNARKPFTEYSILKKFKRFYVEYGNIKKYLANYKGYILNIKENNYLKMIKLYDTRSKKNIYLDGYFQNKILFQIRFNYFKSFINNNHLIRVKNELQNIKLILIGLHIRLGDYLNHKNIFNITNKQYYIKCLDKIMNHDDQDNKDNKIVPYVPDNNAIVSNITDYLTVISVSELFNTNKEETINKEKTEHKKDISKFQIIVFTDNPKHVKKNYQFLKNYNTIYANDYIESNNNIKDTNLSKEELEFLMMRYCEYMICSNSTYSLFATYLGSNKRVYIPDKWFNNKTVNPNKYIMNKDQDRYEVVNTD